jgi:nucleoside-diphosphate-sugar epimerase
MMVGIHSSFQPEEAFMKVLITGAAGRVGQCVVREFADHGYDVRALDRRPLPADLNRDSVKACYEDIADPLAVLRAADGCDTIVHLAAYPSAWGVTAAELLRVNVIGTQNVLDAAVALQMPKVVTTSSIGALGFSFPTHPCLPDYLPIDAAHPKRPQDIYGVSKQMGEAAAEAITRRHGTTTIVIRPPLVMDAKNPWRKIGSMVDDWSNQLQKDYWVFIDQRDLAVAFRLAVEADLTGHHIFFAMADETFANVPIEQLVERFLPQLAGDLPRLTGKTCYDLAPARDLLGFTAKVTLQQMIEESKDAIPRF